MVVVDVLVVRTACAGIHFSGLSSCFSKMYLENVASTAIEGKTIESSALFSTYAVENIRTLLINRQRYLQDHKLIDVWNEKQERRSFISMNPYSFTCNALKIYNSTKNIVLRPWREKLKNFNFDENESSSKRLAGIKLCGKYHQSDSETALRSGTIHGINSLKKI